jgi:hypothetical protein
MEDLQKENSDEKSLQIWFNVLKSALAIPGVKVDRKSFLIKELYPYCDKDIIDKAIETTPAKAGVSKSTVEKIVTSVIKYHTTLVTTIAAGTGIPGGFFMIGTIPVDLAQFYYHILQVVQKLSYIYGWPDIFEEGKELNDETLYVITIFIGVMSGVKSANEAVKIISKQLAKEVAERLPRLPLTKYLVFNVAKQVAKWLGQKLTKETFGRIASKIVPGLGAILAGTLAYVTFKPQCNKLRKHLSELPLAN